jgi:hypothetical protein
VRRRRAATSDFEKSFYKLLNNALFGKTMENVRGYKRLVLVQSSHALAKQVRKATFRRAIKLGEELAAVELAPAVVQLNKPIYMGQAVLDISKQVRASWGVCVCANAYVCTCPPTMHTADCCV